MNKLNINFFTALLLFGFIVGCERKAPPPRLQPTVVVTPATNEDIVKTHAAVGQTVAQDKVEFLARVEGFLVKREFIEGDFVQKGKLLFEIEKDKYQAEVQSAQADLENAQADLINAQIDFKRQTTLLAQKATSQRAYDNARAAKMMADAKVMAAQGKLKIAKINLSYTDIKAPFDGLIGLSTYSVGNVIGPNSGTLATIIKLDPMKVEFNLNEAVILSALQKGNINRAQDDRKIKVRLRLSNGTIYRHDGIIDFIDNRINPATGSIKLRVAFENKKRILLPGQYVNVILEAREQIVALMIPQASIQEDQQGKFVLVVTAQQQVKRKNVTVGDRHGINIIIKSGLIAGELVIVEGLQKVREGMKVKTMRDKMNPAMNVSPAMTEESPTATVK
ncbi:MAG: efflux RND transporter periplasmic adaptor subunit [Victivallaceae bacterium]|nr:efflux RND transporter periplasmic adaptor subunit [Victivallaceae bacterium]